MPQWRAQVMRNVRGNVTERIHQQADAIQHAIQCCSQTIQIVTGPAQDDALLDIAFDDRFSRARNIVDPLQECAADGDATADRNRQREKKTKPEYLQKVGAKIAHASDIVAHNQPQIGRELLAIHEQLFQLAGGLSLIHISEPTRQAEISYAVFCLKKKT